MKQKRKVKSLLPKKNFVNGRFLTILLVVLSLVLCVGGVSLLTHSVLAQVAGGPAGLIGGQEVQVTVNHIMPKLEHASTCEINNEYVTGTTIQTGIRGSTIILEPIIAHAYYTGQQRSYTISSTVNSDNVTGIFYHLLSVNDGGPKDQNGNEIPDGWEKRLTITIHYMYTGGRGKVADSTVITGVLNNASYSTQGRITFPNVSLYHPNKDVISRSKNAIACKNSIEETVRYSPNNDENGNGYADELEYTVNYYKCKEREPFNSITGVCNYEGENVNISIPLLEGYSGVKEGEPCEGGVFPVVKITYNPEKDQNNDCVWDGEQELWEITEFDYTGLDNRVEVLYGMRFLDPSDFTKIVNSIFMSGSSLYISPNPVIVNGSNNTVDTGVYSHILGGENNEVYSNNITLIAGSNNKIHAGNDNASVLGGNGNEVMPGKSDGIPTILVGGEGNKMGTGHDGNALIGGSNNTIGPIEDPYADADEVSDSIVLGGERNAIGIDSYNVIIGGKKVLVQGKHNIFVYSNIDGGFSPRSHNAFYLNVGSGAGINTGGIEGLSVGGAVSVGRVNINIDNCTGDSLGVIGSYEGCLVGCTSGSAASGSGKWELLDQGNECAKICQNNSGHCLNQDDEVVNVEDSRAQCTTGVVNTDNAHLCIDDLDSYKNVIFESSLIDSDEECLTGQNICVYKCDSGFNLKQDPLDDNKRGCYDECKLPWDPTKKIQHGETITGYNVENAVCATDSDKSPIDTCGKHKKQLICYKGKLLLKSSNGKPISGTEATAANYKYETCMLGGYRCKTDSDNYSLYVSDITAVNGYNDTPKDATVGRIVKDRTIAKGVRGNYKLCMDYDGTPPADGKNGENCSTGDITPTPYHYKFVGCNTGDHYMLVNGVCKQQCSLTNSSGDLERYDHGKVETGFKENLVACPGECTGVQLTCDDGSWKLDGETVTGYYNYCNNGEVQCDSSYNLTEQKSGGVYSSCTSYEQGTCKETTKYKLDGCADGYHQVPGTSDCAKNRQPMTCETTGKEKPPYSHYTNTTSGAYEIVWSGGKNDYVEEPENPCAWECDSGYKKSADGKSCVPISNECKNEVNKCEDSSASVTDIGWDESGNWWKCEGKQCHLCNSGYYDVGSGETYPYCDKIQNNSCDNTYPYGCTLTGTANERNSDNITFTWNCLGIPEGVAQGETGCSFSCPAGNSWNFDHKQCEANECAPLPEDEGDVKWCSGATGQATTNNMNPTYDSKCEQPVACKYRCSQGYWRYNGVCTSTNPICGDSLYSCNASFPVNTGSDESHYYRDCEDQDGSILTTVKCELGKERGVCGKAVEGTCEKIGISTPGVSCGYECDDIPANKPVPECCLNMVRDSVDCSSYTGEAVCNNKKTWVPNFHRNMNVCSWNNYLTGDGACYCDGVKCGDENCNEDCHDYGYYYDEFFGDSIYQKPITYWYIDNPFSKYFNVIDPYNVYDTLLVSNVPLQCANGGQVDMGSITIVKPYNRSSVLFLFSSINELNEKLREGSFYSYKYNSGWVEHDRTFTGDCEDDPEGCNRGYDPGDKTVLYIYDYGYGFVRDCDPEHAKVEVEYGKTCSINNMAGPWISTCTNNYDPY